MKIMPKPGFVIDQPPIGNEGAWQTGFNCRFRLGILETIGLFGPLRSAAGAQITLEPDPNGNPYRKVFTTPSTAEGQILFGSAGRVQLLDYDPSSTPATGTRWRQTEVTPAGLAPAPDTIAVPSTGRIEVPPVWWFDDQDDVVVGSRADVTGERVYAWDRNRAGSFAPLAGSPAGAVGGGIINRILVLLGCESFGQPPDVPPQQRFMTIRWSDRFNFEEWTPSDVNLSGELQLEGGSRIVGGGVTGFGVVAWTDRRFALLTETFDPSSVFERRYIDGGRGLIANNAWCESDGQVWWIDEHRVLNVFDGGRPRQILNPLKYATVDRATQAALARGYMEANPEYGEVIFHYPDLDGDEPDTQLVYNYMFEAWSIWRLPRTGWAPRSGVIPTLAVSPEGKVWQHDLDTGLPAAYLQGPVLTPAPLLDLEPQAQIAAGDVEPFSFVASTNAVVIGEAGSSSWRATRCHVNHIPLPSEGAEGDEFSVQITAYGKAQVTDVDVATDTQVYAQGDNARDFRVGGRALQLSVFGTDVKTVFRFADLSVRDAEGGAR